MEKQDFIKKIAGYVQKYAATYGIAVHSPIIAQAVLESGWGESRLAAVYHNYFGLKCGTRWTGKSVNLKTMEEYTPGTLTQIKDNFRVYGSMEEGVKGILISSNWKDTRTLKASRTRRHTWKQSRRTGTPQAASMWKIP